MTNRHRRIFYTEWRFRKFNSSAFQKGWGLLVKSENELEAHLDVLKLQLGLRM